MAENVLYADLNLPEPTRPRNLRVPDVQGKSHGFRTRAAAVVAVLVVIILLMVIALYLTLTMAGSQQDSTTLASTSQNVSTPLFPTSQEDSTKLPPSHEEAPGKSCCSTTRVAVLVTEIILLLLIVVCQILPYGPTAGSQQDSTRTIPEEALGCPTSWKKHGRNCYFFSPEKKPKGWEASRAECTAMGSDLVVIDSREELSYLLPQSRHNYYLLGLTYSQEEQKWKWINNVEHDPAMFSIIGHFRDYLCTVIGFGAVESAPCNGSKTVQNMCEKAATIS
ncbi:killer cell lectin-like receptor subfamily B member 1B allele B isoform X2 [Vidua chalybeata]|uniref:killer cell lectin-like receptor subfamily B member 1B allele B isoform X2 n=1 Tax=Vidua chalybeata TaxID=81927 RepID=UPI0023A7ECE1|nr:killer cell lectin-like receptor subfamily B member 1B allele B isoform X2 [Vidua chalybeata]